MSFSTLKHQVKYCLLNKEDEELGKMKEKRKEKDLTHVKNINSIEEENKKTFNKSQERKRMISDKQSKRLDLT